MKAPDVLYLALITIWLLFEPFVVWPAFVRRSRADAARARTLLWSSWIGLLWTVTAAGVALWVFEARPWEALRLTAPHGWRLWVATALVAAPAVAYARRAVRVARSRRRRRVTIGNSAVERLAPHTSPELRLWMALSITAGCCEEFVFRGYLIWALQPLLGIWAAAALSLVLFAIGHAYQGAKGVAAVGAMGTVLTVVVLALGSLWPAMVMHAIVDAGEGLVAWLVLREGIDLDGSGHWTTAPDSSARRTPTFLEGSQARRLRSHRERLSSWHTLTPSSPATLIGIDVGDAIRVRDLWRLGGLIVSADAATGRRPNASAGRRAPRGSFAPVSPK